MLSCVFKSTEENTRLTAAHEQALRVLTPRRFYVVSLERLESHIVARDQHAFLPSLLTRVATIL